MKGLPELVIGDLKVKRPVIQGGMGVGVSLGQLAGAVAKEGGVGIISTAQIGFREPDFETNTRAANIRAIGSEFQRARETAPDGVIGFNIMVALKDYDEHVKAAVDAGADLIVSGAGLPIELPGLVESSSTKIAPIVSTERSAKVILKYWDKKFSRTADLVVIEGPKAGGHLGFDREQLETYTQESYDNEIERIMAVVRKYAQKYQVHIPVAVAGGISDKDAAEHAFSLGADAVQVATRFVTTWECDADLSYKQSYLNAKKEDVILVKSPVGMPARAINNKFLKRVKKEGRIAPIKCHQCVSTCNMLETPYCITDALINAVSGNVDEGLIFCGAYAYKINDISTVKDIIKNYF